MTSGVWSIPFLRLWFGSTASGIATWALPFVLGFAASTGSVSPVHLGAFLAIRTVGFLAAVPVCGVLADRTGSRRIILVASLVGATGALLVFLHLGEESSIASAFMAIGVLLSGMGEAGCRPVYQSIVPVVVSHTHLQSANAALSLSLRAANLVGPAVATLIAVSFGANAAFFVILWLWVISAFLPPRPKERVFQETAVPGGHSLFRRFADDIMEGVTEAKRHPWFFASLAALATMIATGYSVTNVLVPLISHATFGDASLLAASATAYTAGALLGALMLSNWRPEKKGLWALVGMAMYGFVPLSLLTPETFWLPIGAYFLAGSGMELFNIIWFTAIQREMARDKLARVSSLDFIASYGLAPISLSLIAPLSQWLGFTTILVATSVVCFIAPLLANLGPSASEFHVRRP